MNIILIGKEWIVSDKLLLGHVSGKHEREAAK
jgi:hypothetical protein